MIACEPRVRSDAKSLVEEIENALRQGQTAPFHDPLTATLPTPGGSAPLPPTRSGDGHDRASEFPEQAAVDRQERGAAAAHPGTIRVLLVDDHTAVRQAFGFALRSEVGIEVVGEAGDGPGALEEIRRLQPDLVLMDINLPGMNGIEATRQIRAEFPRIEVIGLSMYESEEQGAAMRRAGARAYVSKSASYETLLAAIRASRESEPS